MNYANSSKFLAHRCTALYGSKCLSPPGQQKVNQISDLSDDSPLASSLQLFEVCLNRVVPITILGGGFKFFFIFIPIWGRFPIWRAYFSNGLKPPTSNLLGLSTYKYWVHPTPCNSGWYTIYSFYWMGPILIITFHPHTGGVCPAYSKKPDAPGKRQGNSHHFEEPKTPVELHLKTWPFWSMFWWGPARISLIQTAPKIRNWMFGNLRTGEKKTTDSFVKVWVCWFVLCGDPQRPSIEVRQCNFAIRSDANGGFLIQ